MFNINLVLLYCELGRFNKDEEFLLAGLSKSSTSLEAAHLHILLAVVMAKQSRIPPALAECQKAI